jgi:signal transduction histidine kinase
MIDAQEQERTRIARELHDDISQRLALLVTDLSTASDGATAHVTKARSDAAQIASDVQALSHRLHSKKLELLGLVRTASRLCEEFAAQQHVRVTFTDEGVPEHLPATTSISLYRILQEALHNAVKHSGAQACRVQLRGTPGDIELLVQDTGSGFNVEAAKASRGIGLVSMEERAALAGGRLTIDSSPGRGTTIRARVPIA